MSPFAVWLPHAGVAGAFKVSEWSESQQTLDAFVDAMVNVTPKYMPRLAQ